MQSDTPPVANATTTTTTRTVHFGNPPQNLVSHRDSRSRSSRSTPAANTTSSPKHHSRQRTHSRVPSSSGINSDTRRQSTITSRHHGRHSSRESSSSLSSTPRSRRAIGTGAGAGRSSLSSQRQADLLSLHFESCRLFQGDSAAGGVTSKPNETDPRDESDDVQAISSLRPLSSSLSDHQQSPRLSITIPDTGRSTMEKVPYVSDGTGTNENENNNNNNINPSSYSTPWGSQPRISTDNSFDWMTFSTRRREYEKIDRANRGFRGWWRHVAPKCCRLRDKRTPFFEEKGGKANYEGSVRRFRMDLPDEDAPDNTGPSHRHGSSVNGQLLPKMGNNNERKKNGSRWLCGFCK